jgi:lysophospholipase L1-like esterase
MDKVFLILTIVMLVMVVDYLLSEAAREASWLKGLRALVKGAGLGGLVPARGDLTLASANMVYYQPYLEHANLPTIGDGESEPERAGYFKSRLMYQYRRSALLGSAGERFAHVFQGEDKNTANRQVDRLFVLGGSVAFGQGAEGGDRYFKQLEGRLGGNWRVIPAALGAINSTQENIILHLVVLPLQPDCVLILDGWNDVVLPSLFSVRPGDPMTMSTLYQKYFHPLFNLRIFLAKRSWVANKLLLRSLRLDRREFLDFLQREPKFREDLLESAARVYVSNLQTMMESCRARGIRVIHALQPSADVMLTRESARFTAAEKEAYQERMDSIPWANMGLRSFIDEAYRKIELQIAGHPWAKDSISFKGEFQLDQFADPVHLNANGQKTLAEILARHLGSRLQVQNNG